MKKITLVAVMIMLLTTFYSCGNTEKILVRKDGNWNIDEYTTTTDFGGVNDTEVHENYGTCTFKDDGTGTIQYSDGSPDDSFTWSVNEDIVTVTFAAIGEAIDFDVIESTRTSQHWKGSYTIDVLGVPVTTQIDFSLSFMD